MNRFCECLVCDTIYESNSALDKKVREELTFTVCSKECEEEYDRNAKAAEEQFKALEFDKQTNIHQALDLNKPVSGTDIKDLMERFANAQNKS